MLLPVNCLTQIMSYLSDTDLYRFCQINNYMANLKHKDIVWKTLFNDQYPDNHIYAELTPYQNYLRLSLVRKFLDLNFKYFKHWHGQYITHSGAPKRHPNRALFIPLTGYNWDIEPDFNPKVLPPSLKLAFSSVGVQLIESPLGSSFGDGHDLAFANQLVQTNNIMLKPKKGDILAFVEMTGDRSELSLIYDGQMIDYCWGAGNSAYLSNINMNWPSVPIDYWPHCAIVPSLIKDMFRQNLTYAKIPDALLVTDQHNPRRTAITNIEHEIYSWCSMSNRKLYLLFERGFTNVSRHNFDGIWNWNLLNDYTHAYGDQTVIFSYVGSRQELEYIIFTEPDE